jgi:hypothetical protein
MRLTSGKAFDTIGFCFFMKHMGGVMRKFVFFVAVITFFFLSNVCLVHAVRGNVKVNDCLKVKNCKFIVTSTATEDPKMSFLVHEKTWQTFTVLDKNDLKRILKAKITEANEKPDKYIHVSKKAPSYERLKRNIENMRSYSVLLSYGKNTKGNLQIDQEILINY